MRSHVAVALSRLPGHSSTAPPPPATVERVGRPSGTGKESEEEELCSAFFRLTRGGDGKWFCVAIGVHRQLPQVRQGLNTSHRGMPWPLFQRILVQGPLGWLPRTRTDSRYWVEYKDYSRKPRDPRFHLGSIPFQKYFMEGFLKDGELFGKSRAGGLISSIPKKDFWNLW